jgi:hypothetical protein
MSVSAFVKNNTQGSLRLFDATSGTALTISLAFDAGDFEISGIPSGGKLNEIVAYERRGAFKSAAHGNRVYPEWSFSSLVSSLSDASAGTVSDFVLRQGAYAAAVSTLGTGTAVPYAFNVEYTIEGTAWGDSADITVTIGDCILTGWAFTEGDPDSVKLSDTVYGAITGDIAASEI